MADYPDGYVEAHLPDYPDETDAPERTSDRMRAVAYPPGVADVVAYSPTVSVYRTVLAAWADEVAALEQERTELLERLGIAWARSKTENEELARLREAIGEIVDEIEEGAGMVHALRRLRALKQGGNSD